MVVSTKQVIETTCFHKAEKFNRIFGSIISYGDINSSEDLITSFSLSRSINVFVSREHLGYSIYFHRFSVPGITVFLRLQTMQLFSPGLSVTCVAFPPSSLTAPPRLRSRRSRPSRRWEGPTTAAATAGRPAPPLTTTFWTGSTRW